MARDEVFTQQQKVDPTQQNMGTAAAELENLGTARLENMTPQQRKTMLAAALNGLSSEARQDVAVEAMEGLSFEQRRAAIQQAGGLGSPEQAETDIIWLIVIIALVLVLLGTSGSLVYGVIFLQRNADAVQVIVTIFTAVIGFLGGLFSPSPARNRQSST